MAEIEIGVFKSGRQAYGLDDIAIVPSRRTRDPEDVDISWEIDAYRFELPLLGSAMDGVISPSTAIELGKLGGLGVLNLEGLWTRYEDPTNLFDEIRELDDEKATARMQQMYSEPIIPELVTARIRQMKEAGITTAASVTPQRTERWRRPAWPPSSTSWSSRAPSSRPSTSPRRSEPLNLKRFIREFDLPVIVGGCASYQAGLHLMRTGAVGVLVGVGPGNACTTRGVLGLGVPQATAIADVAGARMRHLDETGRLRPRDRRRRHVQGRRHRQGHRLRRRRRHARARRSPRPSRPRPAASTGAWPPSTRPCPAGPGCAPRCAGSSARSCSAPPTRTTAA